MPMYRVVAALRGQGYSTVAASRYPLELAPGGEQAIGEARIRLSGDGVLEACDPYGCSTARMPRGAGVTLEPAALVTRPKPLTGCIYIAFDSQLVHPRGELTYWMLAPYEVVVASGKAIIARLATGRAKYTVLGDVVDGVLCRHVVSKVFESRRAALEAWRPGLAFVAVRVSGPEGVVHGVAFQAGGAAMYSDDEGRLYYPLIEARLERGKASSRTTASPPMPGLEPAQRVRRPLLFQPSVEYPL